MIELPTDTDELFLRQLKLEEEMVTSGIDRFQAQIQKAQEKGQIGNTIAGMRLKAEALNPMSQALKDYMNKTADGQAGRHAVSYVKLKEVSPDKASFIALTIILNALTKDDNTLQSVAVNIGKAIEDELRLCKFSKENNPYFKAVMERVKTRSNYRYKQRVLIHAMNNGAEIPWQDWTPTEKLHVGKLLIETMVESTGLIEIAKKSSGRGKFSYYVSVTGETLDWISKVNSRCEAMSPSYLPMLVAPKPWRSPYEGGYYSDIILNKRFVKRVSKEYCQELANSDISQVYAAVNAVQDTGWKINSPVLEVMETLWENNSQLGKLPNRDKLVPPPCPTPKGVDTKTLNEDDKARHEEWCQDVAKIHDRNRSRVSKVMQTSMVIGLARRFKDDVIYFPYSIDWRGRLYPIPNYLNPQGDDFARGLLTFSNGKPLDSSSAVDWLAIHGANTYGFDKVPFGERVSFIQRMTPEILRISEDPYTNKGWCDADKPWQFLAFCFEWANFKQMGKNFISSLPIQLDGTCNGLQHFSAMLKDKIGGEAVNLVPSEQPQDIYTRVATRVCEKLRSDISNGSDNAPLAMEWSFIKGGITRDLTKKPVMVLPYGGTKVGNRKAVESFIDKYMESNNLADCPFKVGKFQAAMYMSDHVWDSIGDVVVSARLAMDWLKRVAQVVSSENIPITWTSPSGLPIQQRKLEQRRKRIETKLMGSLVKLSLVEDTNSIDKVAQQNGISPNFVHSMDAAALHIYVNKMVDEGITNLSLIHDSYGTLAADTETSTKLLRDAFISIYQNDVLEQFRSSIVAILPPKKADLIPPVPPKGELDIDQIRESQFFFA